MSTYAKAEHHIVIVRVSPHPGRELPTLVSVECQCSAPVDAPCRTYPQCDCEFFARDEHDPRRDPSGHLFVPGQPCWVTKWFDLEGCGAGTCYVGQDADEISFNQVPLVSQGGHVDVDLDDSELEWAWAGATWPAPDAPPPVVHGQEPLALGGGLR